MKTVWLLEHVHRHGTDFSGYDTLEHAQHARAATCVREAHVECPREVSEKIAANFSDGDFGQVLDDYLFHVSSETLVIHKLEVDENHIYGLSIAEHRTDVVHSAMNFPNSDAPGISWCGRLFFWGNASSNVTFAVGSSNFHAWIPRELQTVTCLACVVMEKRE